MFVRFDPDVRIHLAVVALGTHDRMRACLDNLVAHESAHAFTVTCVINPTTRADVEVTSGLPAGIRVVTPELNVGWAGGLHVARRDARAELFGWIQDDVRLLPGWLDALVAAADEHEDVGAFGSLGVDAEGAVTGHNGGFAQPPEETLRWGRTDTVAANPSTDLTHFDWVPSRGLLTRTETWDQLGGADVRLYPLDMVDKDYCTHARFHGWRVALVPQAKLQHAGQQSAPRAFRVMINRWNAPHFDRRWGPIVGALAPTEGEARPHDCSPWVGQHTVPVEEIVGQIASRMLVPFGWEASEFAQRAAEHATRVAQLEAQLTATTADLTALRNSGWWRATWPMRAVLAALKRKSRMR